MKPIVGVLALLFCTTHLHYTQNMMENNYIMLLTLTGFSFQYEWLRSGSTRALLVGSGALGLNLLTRLTTGLDLMAAGLFLLLVLWFEACAGDESCGARLLTMQDRGTGLRVFPAAGSPLQLLPFRIVHQNLSPAFRARSSACRIQRCRANFPWSTPFHEGVFGRAVQAGEVDLSVRSSAGAGDSALLVLWKRMATGGPRLRGGVRSLLLAGYISFYARYTYWAGDFAWGDRYVSTAVEMVALLAVPLLLALSRESGTLDLARGTGADRGQPRDSNGVAGFLAAARDLPDGDVGPSHIRDCAALQEHCRLRAGQNGCMGTQHGRDEYDQWDYVHITAGISCHFCCGESEPRRVGGGNGVRGVV